MPEETKKPRTFVEAQQEYQSLCLRAGHLQYQIFALDKDLNLLNDQMRDLNFEAATAKAREDAEAKAAAEVAAPESALNA